MSVTATANRHRDAALVTVGLALTVTGAWLSMFAVVTSARSIVVTALLDFDFLAFGVVGAIVALARPGNRVGWLMLAGGMLSCLGGGGVDLAQLGSGSCSGICPRRLRLGSLRSRRSILGLEPRHYRGADAVSGWAARRTALAMAPLGARLGNRGANGRYGVRGARTGQRAGRMAATRSPQPP